MKRIIAIALIFFSMLLTSACYNFNNDANKSSTDFFAMDTYMSITAYGGNADKILQQAKGQIKRLEGMWSVTDKSSEIYAINHSNGKPTEVSEETSELLTFALDISEKTSGALEPTIYPVLSAWGFTTEQYRIPTDSEIKKLLKKVDYKKVSLSEKSVQLKPEMMIDFGALGKGYASDIAAEFLQDNGVSSALLDLGGNIKTIGAKPDGSDWKLGVKDPKGSGNVGILSVSDIAVVTSGNYERYFIGRDGKKYGHIIDPTTGHPVENGLQSVTIIAKEGKLCDALSTSLFVMGLDKAVDYWRQYQDFDMILITDDREIHITEGIKSKFTIDSDHKDMKINVINNK